MNLQYQTLTNPSTQTQTECRRLMKVPFTCCVKTVFTHSERLLCKYFYLKTEDSKTEVVIQVIQNLQGNICKRITKE